MRLWNALTEAGFVLAELHYNSNCWGAAKKSATDNCWGTWAFTGQFGNSRELGLCGELANGDIYIQNCCAPYCGRVIKQGTTLPAKAGPTSKDEVTT